MSYFDKAFVSLPAAKPASKSLLVDACFPFNQTALKEWKQ